MIGAHSPTRTAGDGSSILPPVDGVTGADRVTGDGVTGGKTGRFMSLGYWYK
jgi:hypothetical protein